MMATNARAVGVVWAFVVTLAAVGCGVVGADDPAVAAVELTLPEGGLYEGDPGAPVTLVEFGSFGCGACAHFDRVVYPRLDSAFVRPGRVRYRYVDVSQGGPFSYAAALSECLTARMGVGRAKRWVVDTAMSTSDMRVAADSAASRVGITRPAMVACVTAVLQGGRRAAEMRAADSLGVNGTPTFVVGVRGEHGRIVGWPYLGIESPDSLFRLIRAVERRVVR
jgi:protein-disulfide isomerase